VYKYFALELNKSVLNCTQVRQLHWKKQLHIIMLVGIAKGAT
jgi:hypothetical protein